MSEEYLNENEENEEVDSYDEVDKDEELELDEDIEIDDADLAIDEEEYETEEYESEEAESSEEEEYEEISSDDVDRVVASLEELIESTSSNNICTHLEEAMNSIFYLVYDESDLEDEAEDASAEAA